MRPSHFEVRRVATVATMGLLLPFQKRKCFTGEKTFPVRENKKKQRKYIVFSQSVDKRITMCQTLKSAIHLRAS